MAYLRNGPFKERDFQLPIMVHLCLLYCYSEFEINTNLFKHSNKTHKKYLHIILCIMYNVSIYLQLMMDFSFITGIVEPMKVVMEKCNYWIPKILKKVKLESVSRRKTFQAYFTTLAEFKSETPEKILDR